MAQVMFCGMDWADNGLEKERSAQIFPAAEEKRRILKEGGKL